MPERLGGLEVQAATMNHNISGSFCSAGDTRSKPVIKIRNLSLWQYYLCRKFHVTLPNELEDILGLWHEYGAFGQRLFSEDYLAITHFYYFCTSMHFSLLVVVNIMEIQSLVF